MAEIKIYTTPWCGYCHRAKGLLRSKGVPFDEIDVQGDPDTRQWLADKTGRTTVPQIFIDGVSIGGSDELHGLDRSGKLDEMLGL